MRLKLGQKVLIEEIEMTVFEIKKTFNGIVYHLVFFNGGNLVGMDLSWKQMKAMGAVVLVEGKGK